MFQYFAKTKDHCSPAIKRAAKQVFLNNMHHHDTMKTINKAYLTNRECSVREEVYYLVLEL